MYLYLTCFQLTSSSLHILSPFIFPWMGLIHPQHCFSIPSPYQQLPDPDAKCVAHPILVLPHWISNPSGSIHVASQESSKLLFGNSPTQQWCQRFYPQSQMPEYLPSLQARLLTFSSRERDPCSWAQHMLDLHGSPSTRLNPVVNP